MALVVVRAVALMPFDQISAVGVVFAIVPVVIVVMVRIVNADRNFLRSCSDDRCARRESSRQK